MKHIQPVLASLFICFLIVSCAINHLNEKKTTITLDKGDRTNQLLISVVKGPQWSHEFRPGPFVIHVYPQMAFWIENEAGELIETLYLTGADGKGFKHATRKQLSDKFYPLCFPTWASKMKQAGKRLPSNEAPYSDAVTSATPQSSYDLNIHMGALPESFTVFAEINKSMDWNATFTKEDTDWIGQPAVIYAAKIDSVNSDEAIHFEAIGFSNTTSGVSEVTHDFTGIDTALELVNGIQVEFKK